MFEGDVLTRLAGLVGIWIFACGLILKASERLDKIVAASERRRAAAWLATTQPSRYLGQFAVVFGRAFEHLFGKAYVSWKCIVACVGITVVLRAYALSTYAFDGSARWGDTFFNLGSEIALFTGSFLVTFVCASKTRYLLDHAKSRPSIAQWATLAFLDVASTALLLFALFVIVTTMLAPLYYGPSWVGFKGYVSTVASIVNEAWQEVFFAKSGLGGELRELVVVFLLGACVYAIFISSWMLLFVLAGASIRISLPANRLWAAARRRLNTTDQPYLTIGVVMVSILTAGLIIACPMLLFYE